MKYFAACANRDLEQQGPERQPLTASLCVLWGEGGTTPALPAVIDAIVDSLAELA
jgi:hypothetical protein